MHHPLRAVISSSINSSGNLAGQSMNIQNFPVYSLLVYNSRRFLLAEDICWLYITLPKNKYIQIPTKFFEATHDFSDDVADAYDMYKVVSSIMFLSIDPKYVSFIRV